jgi:hypothetical protein
MGRAKLNLGVVVPRESYFNMIDDSLIKPSTRALRLDEFYFKARAEKEIGKSLILTEAKAKLKDKNSGVYYNPLWDNTMSISNLSDMVVESIRLAEQELSKAKRDREAAYNELGRKISITIKTARERVDQAIIAGRPDDTISSDTAKALVNSSVKAIQQWVILNTVADAYTNEIQRRLTNESLVKEAIAKGDVKELQALKSKVTVKELKTNIDNAIDEIKKKEEAEAQAKKEAEAKQKAIEEANKKLSGATTPEEKAAAQAELDALLMVGGNGGSKTTLGGNKTLLYVGIGVVVLVGAFFAFRKSN